MDIRYAIHEGLSEEPLLPADIDFSEPPENYARSRERLPRTPQEHLEAARSALADGYKLHKNPMKTTWGRVGDAERHLGAITKKSKEFKEAARLMKEVEVRKESMEKVSSALARRLMIRQREMMADEFEFVYLAKGFDAHIYLSGPDKSCIKMECVSLCEAFVLKMVHETDLLLYFERAGFKKIILGDGEHFSWTHVF